MGVGVATPAKELNRPIREKSTRMGFCFAQGSMTRFLFGGNEPTPAGFPRCCDWNHSRS